MGLGDLNLVAFRVFGVADLSLGFGMFGFEGFRFRVAVWSFGACFQSLAALRLSI